MRIYTINNSKVYVQKVFPFKNFAAMSLYGMIFWRKEYQRFLDSPQYKGYVSFVVNHENIHKAQMKDFCKWIPIGGTIFYLHYLLEWFVRLFINGPKNAYSNLSFEREAKSNETSLNYLNNRKRFSWNKYIKKSEA